MDRKIRVGAVSYLNTKPLLYGIERSPLIHDIELQIDYPSKIASSLLEDKIDIGLVPVAIIPFLKEYHINTDYCIGADGPVASVCLFSEVPIEQVERVWLDYQSRTSVQLVQILLKEYWKTEPLLEKAPADFLDRIKGNTAAVVIGDRALEQRNISKYSYDLGEAWKKHTGLPFVFAAWVSNKKLEPSFLEPFNRANAEGLKRLDEVIPSIQFEVFDIRSYYTRYISYELNNLKLKGLAMFLSKLNDVIIKK